jgi:protein subunit release factor A
MVRASLRIPEKALEKVKHTRPPLCTTISRSEREHVTSFPNSRLGKHKVMNSAVPEKLARLTHAGESPLSYQGSYIHILELLPFVQFW